MLENVGGQSRLRSDTDGVDVFDLLDQLLLRKRGLEELDLVALLAKDVQRGLVDVFQKQDLHITRGERLQGLGTSAARESVLLEVRRGWRGGNRVVVLW